MGGYLPCSPVRHEPQSDLAAQRVGGLKGELPDQTQVHVHDRVRELQKQVLSVGCSVGERSAVDKRRLEAPLRGARGNWRGAEIRVEAARKPVNDMTLRHGR